MPPLQIDAGASPPGRRKCPHVPCAPEVEGASLCRCVHFPTSAFREEAKKSSSPEIDLVEGIEGDGVRG